jgi:thiamine kinase-like enzyme
VGELNDILQDLESSLGALSGKPVPLDGGITNRNYRVTLGGSDYVVRRPGKDTDLLGIDRHAERLATDAAAELGIAPAVAAVLESALVTRFVSGFSLEQREVADGVAEIARLLRAFHESGLQLPSRFWVGNLLADYSSIVTRRGGSLPSSYATAVASTSRIEDVLTREAARPAHNDLLCGNIIRARGGGRIMIVDWEYTGMGDPRFDLGNLSVNNDFGEEDDERLLSAYHGAPPTDGQRAALKLTRVLSDAREGAWGVVQSVVSELEFDFEHYAEEHFERLCATVEQPNFEDWLEAASA